MTDRNRLHWLASGSALATVAALSAVAVPGAALAAEGDKATQVDEVIVTANKREQKVLDVALSVTAVKGSDLAKRSVLQVEDLAAQVPGLVVQNYTKRANRIVLRGLNSGGAGAVVASVIDESALSYSSSTANGAIDIANLDTYDLNRIEVLRGPQGTLYGAAAEGGLVKYITNAPNPSRFEAGLQGEVESVSHGGTGWTTRGLVNIPLSDGKAALRASAFYKDIAGVVDSSGLKQSDIDWGKRYGGRIQALFQPTDDLSIRLSALVQRQYFNDLGQIQIVGNASGTNSLGKTLSRVGGSYTLYETANSPNANRLALYNATIDYKGLSFGDFLSSTSYGKVDSTFHTNVDEYNIIPGITYQFYFSNFVAGKPIHLIGDQNNNLSKFNQEFRLASKPDATLFGKKAEWVGGLFYTHEEIVFNQFYKMYAVSNGAQVTVPPVGGSNLPADYKEISGFASGTLWFTDQFNVQLGGRYSKSWQESQVTNRAGILNGIGSDIINPRIETNEKVFTWSVAPQYFLNPDAQVYARIASGFRPGGPQLLIPGAPADYPTEYQSDSTVNYEIGLKGQFFDRKLIVDVAAFRIDWKDMQILTQYYSSTANAYYNVTGNAGTSRSQGFEWNFLARPVKGLELGFLGAYTDAHLTEDAPGIGGFSGDELTFVPKWTSTVNIDYRWSLSDKLEANVGGTWSYTGERFNYFSTVAANSHLPLPSYRLLSLHAGVDYGNFSASVYANNVTDEYVVNAYSINGWSSANNGTAYFLQPRTIGFRIGYKY